MILDLLRAQERPVGDLVAEIGLSQPAVSKHLRVLRDSGLVAVRSDAQRRLYRVRAESLAALDDWLAPYRALWEARLDDLERHLDAMPDTMPDDGPRDGPRDVPRDVPRGRPDEHDDARPERPEGEPE
jgi:DNA-binding transcriptional ArsR family regulator